MALREGLFGDWIGLPWCKHVCPHRMGSTTGDQTRPNPPSPYKRARSAHARSRTGTPAAAPAPRTARGWPRHSRSMPAHRELATESPPPLQRHRHTGRAGLVRGGKPPLLQSVPRPSKPRGGGVLVGVLARSLEAEQAQSRGGVGLGDLAVGSQAVHVTPALVRVLVNLRARAARARQGQGWGLPDARAAVPQSTGCTAAA